MRYLLDTNVCIRYLNGRAPKVINRIQRLVIDDIRICSIVKFELVFGAWRSQNPIQTLRAQQFFLSVVQSLPFDDAAALEAGKLRAWLADQGTPIGSYDVMIAAIALVNDMTLVTHNVREFGRIPALKIDDWEA